MGAFRTTSAATMLLVAAAGLASTPYKVVATCPAVALRSLELHRRLGVEMVLSEPASLRAERVRASTKPSRSARSVWQITAVGPVLGSMDTQDLQLQASCSGDHLEIRAAAVRSADFRGGVLKYAPWRPELVMEVSARHGGTIQVLWKLFSTSGAEVYQSDLPGGPHTAFPVTTTKVLP